METNILTITIVVCLAISVLLNVGMVLFLFYEARPVDVDAGFTELMKRIKMDEKQEFEGCPQYSGEYIRPGVWGMCETCGGTIEQHDGAKERLSSGKGRASFMDS